MWVFVLDDTEPTIAYPGPVAVDIKHEEAPGNLVADPAKIEMERRNEPGYSRK